MADNFAFTEGSGKTGAADDIGGVLYPRVKIAQGADGSATDVSSAAPLQVSLANHGANATAVKVDGSAVTQPVSAASLPLPTGAATAAKQPALGTAGSASSDVITVQGVASMTALKVDGSAVAQPITDNSGSLTVDAPVGTPVFVRLSDGSAPIATLPVSLASVPSHAVTNAGTFAVQDSEKIADDAAFIVSTTKVQPVGFLADESSTDSVDEGDIGAARMTLDRKVHVVAEHESNSMRAGGTALTPKFAAIAASSSGNNTIVAAVNPKKIRVVAAQLVASAAVNVKWQTGASGTDLTGLAYLAANGGYVLPYNPVGWFETASNTLLNLNLSGAVAVGGSITYVEV